MLLLSLGVTGSFKKSLGVTGDFSASTRTFRGAVARFIEPPEIVLRFSSIPN
jgi:hypothetical protein